MEQKIHDNLSLMAEYEFTFGGAQRMLSAVAKRMKKPIYVLTENPFPPKVWDLEPITGIPQTEIILSLVVDKYKFQIFNGKKQIKFCHSGASLDTFRENRIARDMPWITHRRRAYEYYKKEGFNIDVIPKGYIPYDQDKIEITPLKKDQGIFISRICPQKAPDWAISCFNDANIPLYFAGNYEFKDYVSCLKAATTKNIRFIPPDEGYAAL